MEYLRFKISEGLARSKDRGPIEAFHVGARRAVPLHFRDRKIIVDFLILSDGLPSEV
jgi:hypothetical protein